MADADAGRENSLPIVAELRIDEVCDRFEAAWRAGESPRIEEHLGGSTGEERSVLLAELVAVEIAYRRRQGERPGEEEYAARFPDDAEWIHAVFEDPGRSESAPSGPAKPVGSSIPVTCPGGHSFRVKAKYAGRSGKCPYCDQTVHVPARAPTAGEVDTSVAAGGETIGWEPSDDVPASSAPLDDGRLPEGQRIGRFELIEVLGKGAFGTVYRAHDPRLDREVALKVPRKGVFETEQELDRFLREARAAATLRHPNICPVYEIGEHANNYYIAMAYIAGKPLTFFVDRDKPLNERKAAVLVRKLALALDEAHREGIIHRDLKPSNIMIDQRGEPVIMDFGLARRAGADDPQLTQRGQILGTPAYMPPEQACGDLGAIGPASDVYSLGIILYELLSQERPFEGTAAHIVAQILYGQPDPPSTLRPELDPRLDAICLKAMAKAPGDRYGSMRDFADALCQYLKSGDTEAARHEAAAIARFESEAAQAASVQVPQQERRSLVSWLRRLWKRLLSADRRKIQVYAGIAAGIAFVLVLLGVVVWVKTPTGTLQIEVAEGEDVQIVVSRDGEQVDVIDTRTRNTLTLRPGTYDISLPEGGNDLRVTPKKVTLRRNGRETVEVSRIGHGRASTPDGTGTDGPSGVPKVPKPSGEQMLIEGNPSLVGDPEGNVFGDNSLKFLDIREASVGLKNGRYVFTLATFGSLPKPAQLAEGRRIDFIWAIDIDRNLRTGQFGRGNDYNIHVYVTYLDYGFHLVPTTEATKAATPTIDKEEFQLVMEGNRVSLSFPESYLETASLDWRVQSTTKNSRSGVLAGNPHTATVTFTRTEPQPRAEQ